MFYLIQGNFKEPFPDEIVVALCYLDVPFASRQELVKVTIQALK